MQIHLKRVTTCMSLSSPDQQERKAVNSHLFLRRPEDCRRWRCRIFRSRSTSGWCCSGNRLEPIPGLGTGLTLAGKSSSRVSSCLFWLEKTTNQILIFAIKKRQFDQNLIISRTNINNEAFLLNLFLTYGLTNTAINFRPTFKQTIKRKKKNTRSANDGQPVV